MPMLSQAVLYQTLKAYTIERIVFNPSTYRYGKYENQKSLPLQLLKLMLTRFNIEFVASPSLVSKSTEQPVF
jgi:hypothetical protein